MDYGKGLMLITSGDRLPRPLAAALAAGGLRLAPSSSAVRAARQPRLLYTRGARLPRKPPPGRWLWLCGEPPGLPGCRAAIALGAYDVIDARAPDAAASLLARARELASEEAALPDAGDLVWSSASSRGLLQQLARAARTSMPVLITGETGTGKEEAASLIHRWSRRASGPYVPINCAAIPNELMESELFGHTRGAFSGAIASVDGRLISAEHGTVFLDEIHDTPLSTQAKLLRVLEDGEVTRLGESKSRKVDFRIVAATNRNLGELIVRGAFGRDLYERLATVRIALPPLRERRDDIPALVEHFIAAYFEREQSPRTVRSLSRLAQLALTSYGWPGNIRELRNVVFSALVHKRAGDSLLLSDLPRLEPQPAASGPRSALDRDELRRRLRGGGFNLRAELAALERAALELALEEAGDSPTVAARLLGEVGHGRARDPGGTVRAMMRRHGLR